MDSGLNHGKAVMPDQYEDHVRSCPHCKEFVPLWHVKADLPRLQEAAQKLISDAKSGNLEVLVHRRGDVCVYFRCEPTSEKGLLVEATPEGRILSIDDRLTVADFNAVISS